MYRVRLNNQEVNVFDMPSEAEDFATDLKAGIIPGYSLSTDDVVEYEDDNGWHEMAIRGIKTN